MLWSLQQARKIWCPHDFRVTAYDARILGADGKQYELEQCAFCLEFRRGAVVKHNESEAT